MGNKDQAECNESGAAVSEPPVFLTLGLQLLVPVFQQRISRQPFVTVFKTETT
jgi:hypothetical protein